MLSASPRDQLEDAVADVMPRLKGAFSTVAMVRDKVVAFRDPAGIRPLSIGRIGQHYCVASETCAFDIIGAEHVRDVEPGECVVLDERGITTRCELRAEREAFCVFEYIYFARPDSQVEGRSVYEARRRIGAELAAGPRPPAVSGEYRAEIVEGCGHFLLQERPAEVIGRITAWLGAAAR